MRPPQARIASTAKIAAARKQRLAIALDEFQPVEAVDGGATVEATLRAAVERFIATQDIRVVLYVNQNTRNFQMFRYGRRWHVFINHGESDKMYMTTNQFKAYDYALVAGQAALDRLSRKLWDFDLVKKAIPIGRPQAPAPPASVRASVRPTPRQGQ